MARDILGMVRRGQKRRPVRIGSRCFVTICFRELDGGDRPPRAIRVLRVPCCDGGICECDVKLSEQKRAVPAANSFDVCDISCDLVPVARWCVTPATVCPEED